MLFEALPRCLAHNFPNTNKATKLCQSFISTNQPSQLINLSPLPLSGISSSSDCDEDSFHSTGGGSFSESEEEERQRRSSRSQTEARRRSSKQKPYLRPLESDTAATRAPLQERQNNHQRHRQSVSNQSDNMANTRSGKSTSAKGKMTKRDLPTSSKSPKNKKAKGTNDEEEVPNTPPKSSLSTQQRAELQARYRMVLQEKDHMKPPHESKYSDYQKLVRKQAQQALWHGCKFLNDLDAHLDKAVLLVRKYSKPKDVAGLKSEELEGEELEMMQRIWIHVNAEIVRRGLNKKRNYCKDQVGKVYKDFYEDGRED